MEKQNIKLLFKVDTIANWEANNPKLENKEIGFERETGKYKIGDGNTKWNDLPYGGVEEITVADGKVYAMDGSRRIELVQAYQTYGVSIDLSNAAVGMVAGSPDWYKMSIFNKIKPCLFKNGAVVGYLNPDNFAQFEDGSVADITSGDAGDVMIEIPKTGYLPLLS